MTSLVLIDAGMRYREGHWREDVGAIRKEMISQVPATMNSKNRGIKMKAINKAAYDITENQKKINDAIYRLIDGVNGKMSEEAKKGFDNMATAFGIIAEELVNCKNRTELVTIVRLYNEGYFKDLFNKVRDEVQSSTEERDAAKESEETPEENTY